MRLLGIDWGSKRIGLAVAEAEHGVVSPRAALATTGVLKKDAAALSDLARREEADALVIGLPLEPGGVEGRMARIVRQLAAEIESLGHRVSLVDETLTSVEAESQLYDQGLKASRRRRLRDGEAARLILERYLDEG